MPHLKIWCAFLLLQTASGILLQNISLGPNELVKTIDSSKYDKTLRNEYIEHGIKQESAKGFDHNGIDNSLVSNSSPVNGAGTIMTMIENGGWGLFKSKVLEAINLFSNRREEGNTWNEIIPTDKIKNFLEMGDKIFFMRSLSNKLNPEFSNFIVNNMSPIFETVNIFKNNQYFDEYMSNNFKANAMNLTYKWTKPLISNIQKVIKDYATEEDLLLFRKTLDAVNPLAVSSFDMLLDLRSSNLSDDNIDRSVRKTRMTHSYERENWDRDDPYGHGQDSGYSSGGYHTTSYHSSSPSYPNVDPYLILAGLGAATLLAYVAYRILVTTEGLRLRSRSLLSMELSDLPDFVHKIYSMIENTENMYGDQEEDDFIDNLNSLWQESEGGCVRCVLHNQIKDGFKLDRQYLEYVVTAGVAHMLGGSRSGQLLDEVSSQSEAGNKTMCVPHEGNNHTCSLEVQQHAE